MARSAPRVRSWNTAFRRFSLWADKGVWKAIFDRLSEDADFEEVFLDSTIVRAHQHGAGASRKRGNKVLAVHKGRNLIERFFARIKQFRRIATRHDELAVRFEPFISIAAAFIWLT